MVIPGSKEIEQAIYECIWKVKPSLETFPMSPDTRLSSVGLQSIEVLTVVFEIEDRFSISIVDRQLDTFRTIGECRDLVRNLLTEGPTSAAAPAME